MVRLTFSEDSQTKVSEGRSGSNVYTPSVFDEVYYNSTGSAITKGTWVVHSYGVAEGQLGRAVKPSDAADLATCVGMAMEEIGAGEWGNVRRSGTYNSNVEGSLCNVPPLASGTPLFTATGGAADGTAGNNSVGVVVYSLAGTLTVIDIRCA